MSGRVITDRRSPDSHNSCGTRRHEGGCDLWRCVNPHTVSWEGGGAPLSPTPAPSGGWWAQQWWQTCLSPKPASPQNLCLTPKPPASTTSGVVAQFFQSAARKEWRQPGAEGAPSSFGAWIKQHSAPKPRRGNDGMTHLVFELDNLYVKVGAHADVERGQAPNWKPSPLLFHPRSTTRHPFPDFGLTPLSRS